MGQEPTGEPASRVWPAYASVIAYASLPCAELLAANAGEVDLSRLGLWWSVLVAVAATIVALAQRWDHARRTAVFVSLLLYLGFRAPQVEALQASLGFSDSPHGLGWLMLTLVALTAAVPLSRRRGVQLFITIAAVGFLVVSTAPLFGLQASGHVSQPGAFVAEEPVERPNIWVLVPDGYSRADVMRERTGLDLSQWTSELEARGFDVADQARANYPSTWASLAAMLQMDYVIDEDDRLVNRRPLYDTIRGNNATVRTLQDWGYEYVHSGGVAWEGSRCGGYEDHCIGRSGLTETDWALLRMTPIASRVQSRFFNEVARLSDPSSVTDAVLDENPSEPYVVFSHLLTPHPPFVRDGQCNTKHDVPTYAQGQPEQYRGMVECLNQQLLDAIDTILRSDEDAVIIIQSDHGHDWGVNWYDPHDPAWESSAGRDRWPVFAALRLPGQCSVPEGLSPVNTMRLLLACLTGQDADPLPYRSWITTYTPDVLSNPFATTDE